MKKPAKKAADAKEPALSNGHSDAITNGHGATNGELEPER